MRSRESRTRAAPNAASRERCSLSEHGLGNFLLCGLKEPRRQGTEEGLNFVDGGHGLPGVADSGSAIEADLIGLALDGNQTAQVAMPAGEQVIEDSFSERHEYYPLHKHFRFVPLTKWN